MTDKAKAGIGCGEDLLPVVLDRSKGSQNAEITTYLNGRKSVNKTVYPEIDAKFNLWMECDYTHDVYDPVNYSVDINTYPNLKLDYILEKYNPADGYVFSTYDTSVDGSYNPYVSAYDSPVVLNNPLDWSAETYTRQITFTYRVSVTYVTMDEWNNMTEHTIWVTYDSEPDNDSAKSATVENNALICTITGSELQAADPEINLSDCTVNVELISVTDPSGVTVGDITITPGTIFDFTSPSVDIYANSDTFTCNDPAIRFIDNSPYTSYPDIDNISSISWQASANNIALSSDTLIADTTYYFTKADYTDNTLYDSSVKYGYENRIILPDVSEIDGLTSDIVTNVLMPSDTSSLNTVKSLFFDASINNGNINTVFLGYTDTANYTNLQSVVHTTNGYQYNDRLSITTDVKSTTTASYQSEKRVFSTTLFPEYLNGQGYFLTQSDFVIGFVLGDILFDSSVCDGLPYKQKVALGNTAPFQETVFSLPDGYDETSIVYHLEIKEAYAEEIDITAQANGVFSDTSLTTTGFDLNTKNIVLSSDYTIVKEYYNSWKSDPYVFNVNELKVEDIWSTDLIEQISLSDYYIIPVDVTGPYTISYQCNNWMINVGIDYITDDNQDMLKQPTDGFYISAVIESDLNWYYSIHEGYFYKGDIE